MRFLITAAGFGILELLIIAAVVLISRKDDRITVAPGLDLAISALTWIPWLLAGWLAGFWAIVACVVGQFVAAQIFCFWHWKNSGHAGPSIGRTLNRIVGPASNNLALVATLPALPAFLLIRFAQLFTYPILVKLIRLPAYNTSEWVSVSRQKFQGLVGHDLLWCLYCDWMTGIYALGGEMLRNLESFWCPLRFYPGKKCENCRLEFPDIDIWVPHDATMADVEKKLIEKYEGRKSNSWWGHPDRRHNGGNGNSCGGGCSQPETEGPAANP